MQLYVQEKMRTGELRVGTLNPASVMTKLIDDATLEKHFEKLGMVDLECRSDARVGSRDNEHAVRRERRVRLHPEVVGLDPRGRDKTTPFSHGFSKQK